MYGGNYSQVLYFVPLVPKSALMLVPHCFDYWRFVMYFEIRKYISRFLLSQMVLAIWSPFWFQMNLNNFIIYLKNDVGIFNRDCIEFASLDNMDVLIILIF